MSGPYKRTRAKKNATVEERLRLHMIEAPSGCWIWVGARSSSGHGKLGVDGRTLGAHRLSYETWVGPIPPGLHIDHLCRRPACINPRHLQAVTPSVNVRRGTAPCARALRRENCLRGHSYAEFGRIYDGKRTCTECHRLNARKHRASAPPRPPRVLDPNDPRHGTASVYANYRCRCDPCREAHVAAGRAYRAKARAS